MIAVPTMTTLEERARTAWVANDAKDDQEYVPQYMLMAAFARSAHVEALEKAAEQAEAFRGGRGDLYLAGYVNACNHLAAAYRADAERVRNGGTL